MTPHHRLFLLTSAALIASCQCSGAKLSSVQGDIGVVSQDDAAREVVSRDAVYDFGAIPIGQTRALKLVVRNLGSGPLRLTQLNFVQGSITTIGPARAPDASFRVAFAATELTQGGEAQFDLEYAPTGQVSSAWTELTLKAEGTTPGAETARIVLKGAATGCGNLVLDPQETCDPPSSCPSSCADQDVCTSDVLVGSASTCSAVCRHTPLTECVSGDGCCPSGCLAATDHDCPGCGNGTLEDQETCDPPSSCPSSCADGDACTSDTMTGAAATCDAVCANVPVTSCRSADGCCPTGCSGLNDADCSGCGNLVVDPAETCDPPSSCPSSCSDNNACTADALTGAAATCTAACRFTAINSCVSGDGCCPTGCGPSTDHDCAGCGNGRIEGGEACDPPGSCPTTCADANACTTDVMTGSALTCTTRCSHTAIVACQSGDGCCPSGCTGLNDTDCTGCGNSVCDSPQETCLDCVTDCGAGYSLQTPNASCMGGITFAGYGKWCSTELVIIDTSRPGASGTIDVEVRRTRAHVLVLNSFEAAQWSVHLQAGHQLQRILVSGTAAQAVVFVGGGTVPVAHYDTPTTWFGCGSPLGSGCDTVTMQSKAEAAAANAKLTFYLGCPEMNWVSVN